MKGNMQDKTNKKKDKHENKVGDLKPVKDPKGGFPPGPCGSTGDKTGPLGPGAHYPAGPPV